MEMLKELLLSGAGLGIIGLALGMLLKTGVKHIKETKNKTDDKALKVGVDLLVEVLDEFDLGKTEDVLRTALKKADLIDDDTSGVEKVLNDKLADVTKKQK